MLPLLAVYMLCACAGVCVLVCVCLSVGPPTRQLAVAYVDLTSTGRYDLGPQSVLVLRDRPVREICIKTHSVAISQSLPFLWLKHVEHAKSVMRNN